jgi:hypothetical protein
MKHMELHQVLIKNFNDYVEGREVEARVEIKGNKLLHPGERVLAFKDSLAAVTSLPVPREKQDHTIGVEGTITAVEIREPVKQGSGFMKLRVKKI